MNHWKTIPYVGLLLIYIKISFSRSLKDRRQVVRSVLDRISKRWNVSAIDMGPSESRSDAVLAISGVGTSAEMVKQRLGLVYAFVEKIESGSEFEIINYWQEVDCYDDFSLAENKQANPEGDLSAFGVQDQE